MSQTPLPVAVIGVGGVGGLTLQALTQLGCAEVVGVADRDPLVAEQTGRRLGLPFYSDNRSLLAERRPRAVYLAVPPMDRPELLAACMQRGIHIWTEAPLARSLDEGLAMVRLADEAGVKLAVGTQRRFAAGYRKAWQLRGHVGEVFLARAHYLFNWGPELAWRGDKSSAGGGALLELGYHPIDLLVWMLGLPEVVYGFQACGHRPDKTGPAGEPLPLYNTDDTAAALLRYSGGCMASVVTTRQSGPVSEELALHGQDGSLVANPEGCLLRNPDGDVLNGTDAGEDMSGLSVYRRQAESFVRAVSNDAKTYECSGWENLLNLAVIEAIYLSDRTGQGEGPLRLLQARELSREVCLRLRPPEPSG